MGLGCGGLAPTSSQIFQQISELIYWNYIPFKRQNYALQINTKIVENGFWFQELWGRKLWPPSRWRGLGGLAPTSSKIFPKILNQCIYEMLYSKA
jgi:hypothetical protein